MRAVLAIVLALGGCQLLFSFSVPPCESAIGHDEDDDGLDDGCDPCPAVAGPGADRDADGLGDDCDPTPEDTCEHRAFFDGFGRLDPGLVVTDPLEVSGDDLVQPETNGVTTIATYPLLRFSDTLLRAGVGGIAFDEAQRGVVEIASGTLLQDDALEGGYACQLVSDVGLEVVIDPVGGNSVARDPFVGVPDGDLVFELENRPSGEVRCTVSGNHGAGDVITADEVIPASEGGVAFLADKASALVHWIEVIELACP